MSLKNWLTIIVAAAVATAPYFTPYLGPYGAAFTAIVSLLGGLYHLNTTKG